LNVRPKWWKKDGLPTRRALAALLLGAMGALGGTGLRAEAVDADLDDLPLERLMQLEVVSASRIARHLSDSPSAVSVVTAEEIRRYGYRTLSEVLAGMRGLFVTNDYRYDYLGGRGFGAPDEYAGRLLLLIDGYAAQDNIYGQAYLDQSSLVDVELIDRVEYVPGTGSALYGNGAFLGIINVTTKKGRDVNALRLNTEQRAYGWRSQGFTLGKVFDNGLDVLWSSRTVNSEGQTRYFPYFDDLYATGGVVRGRDGEQAWRHTLKLAYGPLTLAAGQTHRIKASPLPRRGNALNRQLQVDDLNRFSSLQWEQDIAPHLKGQAHLYSGFYQDRFLQEFGTRDPLDQYLRGDTEGSWWGVHQRFTYTGLDGHLILAGFEYRDDERQRMRTINLDGQGRPNGLVETDKDWNQEILSAYVTEEVRIGEQWAVQMGARLDKVQSLRCTLRPCEAVPLGLRTSPRASLTWRALQTLILKASHNQAFRLPTVRDQYSEQGRFVPPERVTTQELSLQYDISTRLRLTGAAYRLRLADVYFLEAASGRPNLGGEPSNRGVELQLDHSGEDGRLFKASLAWQNAKDANRLRAANVPSWLGHVSYSQPLPLWPWMLGLEVNYLGRRTTLPVQGYEDEIIRNGRLLGGVALAHLTLSTTRPWNGISVSMGLKNLFDRRLEVASPRVFDRDNRVLDSIQGDGRVWWLRLSWEWGL
jgi:outer membrane receptor protein involved in Fe transport